MTQDSGSESQGKKTNPLMRRLLILVQFLLGIFIVIILLERTDLGKLSQVLISSQPTFVIMASGLIIFASSLIALSFYFILRSLGYKMSVSKCVRANFGGQLASDLTPGRVGYFITPFIMETLSGVPFESCLAATIITGAVDFLLRALLTLISIIYFTIFVGFISASQWLIVLSTGILASGSLALALLVWSKKSRMALHSLGRIKWLSRFIDEYMVRFDRFQVEGAKAKGSVGLVAAFMFAASLFEALALYLFALSVGVSLNPIAFVFILSLASSFTYLPLTLAGLGVQESILALLLQQFGVGFAYGISIAFLFRFFYTVTDIIGVPSIIQFGFLKAIGWHQSSEET